MLSEFLVPVVDMSWKIVSREDLKVVSALEIETTKDAYEQSNSPGEIVSGDVPHT
jgi:hypothetical protein